MQYLDSHDLPHLEEPLSEDEKRVRDFHAYLRNKRSYSHGYTVDLRKAMQEVVVNGKHPESVSNVDAVIMALNEFVQFRNESTEEEN